MEEREFIFKVDKLARELAKGTQEGKHQWTLREEDNKGPNYLPPPEPTKKGYFEDDQTYRSQVIAVTDLEDYTVAITQALGIVVETPGEKQVFGFQGKPRGTRKVDRSLKLLWESAFYQATEIEKHITKVLDLVGVGEADETNSKS